eukprot:SAG31_NODE_39150_length_290_cov_1.104712_1_plen_47_part_10
MIAMASRPYIFSVRRIIFLSSAARELFSTMVRIETQAWMASVYRRII